ncbi:transposon, En/Spm-like protein, partial [Tanacetum coccineum]
MKQQSFIHSAIIQGEKGPGNDIDVYLQPLIKELNLLWKGVDAYDAFSKERFKLRASILWTVNDFPAYANLSGWSTKGRVACPTCANLTHSMWLKHGKKFCYMGHPTWKMFRSKATMEQHAKKYTQNKNNSTRMESHMQTISNLHDDSHRPSSFSHTLFRPPFCSTIQQNCFPSSSSADFQSIRSNPTTYNPNLYDSMIHHSTSSSYSKPTTFEPMLHQSTSSSYSKPSTFEPMLHPSTSTLSDQPSSSRTSLHQFSSSFHLNQDDEDKDEDEDEDEDEIDEESKE